MESTSQAAATRGSTVPLPIRARIALPAPKHAPTGFSLIELLVVVVIIGLMTAMAVPRLDTAGYRTDSAMQQVGSTLLGVQRAAITRQHDMVVAFDEPNNRLRIHYDNNSDGKINNGESNTYRSLGEGVVFGRGGAAARYIGADAVTFKRMQGTLKAVTFRRNGSATEEGGFYITSIRAARESGRARDARSVTIDRATGRPSWYTYNGAAWTQEF